MFTRAREQAMALDDHFVKTQQLKGPLHGVPFSVKVQGKLIFNSVQLNTISVGLLFVILC